MGWFRRSGQAARDTDPLFSWGERIGKLLWEFFKWVVGPSTVSGLALVGLGWATYGLFYGALAGAVAFALMQLSLTLRLFRNSAVEARLSTEPQPETCTPQSTSAGAPTDTNPRQAQEVKQLTEALNESRQETKELRGQIERLKTVIHKQQEMLNRYDGNRLRFKELLQNALGKGAELRGSKPSESEAREWVQRVHDFIDDANDTAAYRFMHVDPGKPVDLDATPEQAYLDKRISQLSGLIQEVGYQDAVPFRPGFDSHDYDLDTLAPREGNSYRAERNALREEAEELRTERDALEGQPANKDLKRRSQELVEELFQFLEDHGTKVSDDPHDPWVKLQEDELVKLYRKRFGGRVRNLLRDLEQRGWYPPSSFESYNRRSIEHPLSTHAVEQLTDLLSDIANR